MKLDLLFDMDGMICNLLAKLLRDFNRQQLAKWPASGPQVFTTADVTDWDIHTAFGCTEEQVYGVMRTPGYFDDLEPIPGAIDAVKSLSKRHNCYIVTAPSREPQSAAEKIGWIRRHLPFIPRRNIVLTPAKNIVAGDFLLDDAPHQLTEWGARWGVEKTITISYPYNIQAPVGFRAHDWTTPALAWEQIVRYLENVRTASRGAA